MLCLLLILLGSIAFGGMIAGTTTCYKNYPVGYYPRHVYFLDRQIYRNRNTNIDADVNTDNTYLMSDDAYNSIIKEKENKNENTLLEPNSKSNQQNLNSGDEKKENSSNQL